MHEGQASSDKKWRWITNVIVYSIPIPMIYLLFWDIALKPHIKFNSAPFCVYWNRIDGCSTQGCVVRSIQ